MNVAGADQHPANRLWVGSLNGGSPKPLVLTKYNAQYSQGHLLFVQGGNFGGILLAQPFDPVRLETSGTPITLATQVGLYGSFAGSPTTRFVQRNAAHGPRPPQRRLEWLDRKGPKTASLGDPRTRFLFAVSPDASRWRTSIYDPANQTTQVWIFDAAAGVRTRLTAPPGDHVGPVWSPDGSRSPTRRT
jgi:hypothetical protein